MIKLSKECKEKVDSGEWVLILSGHRFSFIPQKDLPSTLDFADLFGRFSLMAEFQTNAFQTQTRALPARPPCGNEW